MVIKTLITILFTALRIANRASKLEFKDERMVSHVNSFFKKMAGAV